MIKTIAKVGYAKLSEDAEGNITYSSPVTWFKSKEAGGREFSAEPNGEVAKIEADGQYIYNAEDNQGYDISLTLIDIIDNINKDWLGNVVTDEGVFEYNNNNEKPRFALLVANETLAGKTKYSVDTYYNCMVSGRPTRSSKTSAGTIDPNFPEYKISSYPLPDTGLVRSTKALDTLPEEVAVPTSTNSAVPANNVVKSAAASSK